MQGIDYHSGSPAISPLPQFRISSGYPEQIHRLYLGYCITLQFLLSGLVYIRHLLSTHQQGTLNAFSFYPPSFFSVSNKYISWYWNGREDIKLKRISACWCMDHWCGLFLFPDWKESLRGWYNNPGTGGGFVPGYPEGIRNWGKGLIAGEPEW